MAENDLEKEVNNNNDNAENNVESSSQALRNDVSLQSNDDYKAAISARDSQSASSGLVQLSIVGKNPDSIIGKKDPDKIAPERNAPEKAPVNNDAPKSKADPDASKDASRSPDAQRDQSLGPAQNEMSQSSTPENNIAHGPENAKKPPVDDNDSKKKTEKDPSETEQNPNPNPSEADREFFGPAQNEMSQSSTPGENNIAHGPANAKKPPQDDDAPKSKEDPNEFTDASKDPNAKRDQSLGPGNGIVEERQKTAQEQNNVGRTPEGAKVKSPPDDGKGDKTEKPGENDTEKKTEKREQSDSIKKPEPEKRSITKEPDYLVMNSPFPENNNVSSLFNKSASDVKPSFMSGNNSENVALSYKGNGQWDGGKESHDQTIKDGSSEGIAKFNQEKYNEKMNEAYKQIMKIGDTDKAWTAENAKEINKILNQVKSDLGQKGLNELVSQLEKDFTYGKAKREGHSYLEAERDSKGDVSKVNLLYGEGHGFGWLNTTHTAYDKESYVKNPPKQSPDMDWRNGFKGDSRQPEKGEEKKPGLLDKVIDLAPKTPKVLPPQAPGADVSTPSKIIKHIADTKLKPLTELDKRK